ncbi:MAG: GNAT family N-acetyltransferase [Alphaproteobacteria bacterium]|nr:GNAT family N-acetyltransferase [Alphaproteobacteria bacterium]
MSISPAQGVFPVSQTATLRDMTIDDYDAVIALWQQTEYVNLNECDTRDGIDLYLRRNPGLCFVAETGNGIVGAVLCGHDGRRGFLRHLAVARDHRQSGVGKQLVNKVMDALHEQGIGKCNIFVDNGNKPGFSFWEYMGWGYLRRKFSHLANRDAPVHPLWGYTHT